MAFIAEQWGRLLWWFNSNSDAIQAFSSLATVFLTVYLLKTVTATERGRLHSSSSMPPFSRFLSFPSSLDSAVKASILAVDRLM